MFLQAISRLFAALLGSLVVGFVCGTLCPASWLSSWPSVPALFYDSAQAAEASAPEFQYHSRLKSKYCHASARHLFACLESLRFFAREVGTAPETLKTVMGDFSALISLQSENSAFSAQEAFEQELTRRKKLRDAVIAIHRDSRVLPIEHWARAILQSPRFASAYTYDEENIYLEALNTLMHHEQGWHHYYQVESRNSLTSQDLQSRPLVGIHFQAMGDRFLLYPHPGFPAEQAGVQPGDVLLEINGERAQTRSKMLIEKKLDAATKLGRIEFKVARNGLFLTFFIEPTLQKPSNVEFKDGVLRIRNFFSKNTCADTIALLKLIVIKQEHETTLDLRGNIGGRVGQLTCLNEILISEEPMLISKTDLARSSELEASFALGKSLAHQIQAGLTHEELVFLRKLKFKIWVDQRTASAAEMFVARLKIANRALILGSRTSGKATFQTCSVHSKSSVREFRTTALFLETPLSTYDQKGIEPDVQADFASNWYPREGDQVALHEGLWNF